MLHRRPLVRATGALVAAIAMTLSAAAFAQSRAKQTVVGIVEANEYDLETDAVVSVSIWSDESGYFDVTADGKGPELLELVGATIRATGVVTSTEVDGELISAIRVVAFEVVEDAPQPPDDTPED